MKKWYHWALLIFCALVLLPTLVQRTGRTDLHILVQAADRFQAHEPVYRLEDANEHTKPPLVTLAMVPFSWIPLFWLSRIWDCAVLLAVFFLMRALLKELSGSTDSHTLLALYALFLVLTPVNAELRLGQYNLLLLTLIVVTTFKPLPFYQGSALALAVLFKPTFILLAPWTFRYSTHRLRTIVGGLTVVATLSLVYAWFRSTPQLIADFQEWVRFLPQSSAKHLLRFDNHGLPSVLAASGFTLSDGFFQLTGLAIAAFFAWRGSSRLFSLSVACAATVFFSPMAWLQNYTLLLPAVLLVLQQSASEKALRFSLVLLWFGIGFINPTTSQWLGVEHWGWQRIPFWSLAAALVWTLIALRDRTWAICVGKPTK
jgi:hypothetical protein